MKKLFIYSALVLGLTITSISGSSVSAYSNEDGSIENTSSITWNEFDPLSWNQFNAKGMPESWLGDKMLNGASGVSFPEGGDLVYVYTFLSVKTMNKMMGYTPSFANSDLEYSKAYTSDGLVDLTKPDIWGNGWKYDTKVTSDLSIEKAKKLYDTGKLVILEIKNTGESALPTHYIAIDGIDKDGDVYIFDSYSPSYVFSDAYTDKDIVSITTLVSDSAKSYDLPKLYQNRGSQDLNSPTGERDKETLGGGGAKSQKEIEEYVAKKSKVSSKDKKVTESSKKGFSMILAGILVAVLGTLGLSGGILYKWLKSRNNS